jgi:hypothetical protein
MRFLAKIVAAALVAGSVFPWTGSTVRGAGDCPSCGCGDSDSCSLSACPTCDGGACGEYPGALGSGGPGCGCGSGADRLFGRGQGCGSGGRVLDSLRSACGTIGLAGCHSCGKKQAHGAVVHCGMAAPEYPTPFPTPKPTTWTEHTYPPFMPHNSLPHYRGTYSFRHAPGLARTNVMWYPTKVQNTLDRIHNMFEIPR